MIEKYGKPLEKITNIVIVVYATTKWDFKNFFTGKSVKFNDKWFFNDCTVINSDNNDRILDFSMSVKVLKYVLTV